MAADAAKRFRQLVAAGHEIPYDVEEPGNGSPLPRYIPLTQRFVRDNAPALLELDSFGSACAAIESAELAGPYLEEFGIKVRRMPASAPSLPGSSSCAVCGRIHRLLARRQAAGRGDHRARGRRRDPGDRDRGRRPAARAADAAGAARACDGDDRRADTVEVPAEARASEGGAAGWEPTFRRGAGERRRGGRRMESPPDTAPAPSRPFAS